MTESHDSDDLPESLRTPSWGESKHQHSDMLEVLMNDMIVASWSNPGFALWNWPTMHPPATCPKCGEEGVRVYELRVPQRLRATVSGAIHLAPHDCPHGGDHLQLQPRVRMSDGKRVEDD